MSRKLTKKAVNGKGLKGALARHSTIEGFKRKSQSTVEKQKDQQILKEKSIKNKNGNKKKKQQQQQQQKQQKGLIPFTPEDKLLLVGEGDFSFAVSIIRENLIHAANLVATSYDSKEELIEKYPNVEENLTLLEEEGVKLLHGVDATNLVTTMKLAPSGKNKKSKASNMLFSDSKNLDYIMFNFPHTGKGMKDVDRNIRDHQKLILSYFQSCKEVFKLLNNEMENDFAGYVSTSTNENKGKVILTLFEGEPYTSWNIKILGRSEDFKVERSGKFNWGMFPDYHHRRTNSTRDTTKPASERDARSYVFEPFTRGADEPQKKNDDSDDD